MNTIPVLTNWLHLKQTRICVFKKMFNVKSSQEGTWMEMWNVLPEESPTYKVLKDFDQLH